MTDFQNREDIQNKTERSFKNAKEMVCHILKHSDRARNDDKWLILKSLQAQGEDNKQTNSRYRPRSRRWHPVRECLASTPQEETQDRNHRNGQSPSHHGQQVTPSRKTTDARSLFQSAKRQAGKKATKVITDGAFAYGKAIKKEFATRENPKPLPSLAAGSFILYFYSLVSE